MAKQSVLGDDPFAASAKVGETAPRAETPRSSTKAEPVPGRAGSAPREKPAAPPPALEDGAAARRAARATASSTAPIWPRVEVSRVQPPPGGSLDPGAGARGTTLADEIRRIEQRLIRRRQGDLQPVPRRDLSFLDWVGQLLDLQTYRRWVADFKMRNHSDTVDEFGFDPIYAERVRPLLDFLYRSYFRVETTGIEHIPDHDRALIVCNHAGAFPWDSTMVMCAVKHDHPAHRDVRPLVEDFVFHFPFLGVALNRIGCVRACQENAERLLARGRVAAVFPEGVQGTGKLYRNRYQLQRFGRGGFVKLALQAGAPIIPTAIIGSEEVNPMVLRITWLAKYLGIPYLPITPTFPWLGVAGALPLPAKWHIHFGEPIEVSSEYGENAAEDRILVNRLTERVRSTIQGMVDEALQTRRSVLFG